MPDIYDKAVEYLTEAQLNDPRSATIFKAWSHLDDPGGILFGFASEHRNRGGQIIDNEVDSYQLVGCLTQIRGGGFVATRPELTEAIKADGRIPTSGEDVTVNDLPVFAEWQRKLDKELGRTPPDHI